MYTQSKNGSIWIFVTALFCALLIFGLALFDPFQQHTSQVVPDIITRYHRLGDPHNQHLTGSGQGLDSVYMDAYLMFSTGGNAGTYGGILPSGPILSLMPHASDEEISRLSCFPVNLQGYKVMIGAQNAQDIKNVERGIARYVRTLSMYLLKMVPDSMYSIDFSHVYGLPEGQVLDALLEMGNVTMASAFHPLEHPLSQQRILYHVMSPFMGYDNPVDCIVPPVIQRSRNAKLICTVHDIIPLLYREQYLSDPQQQQMYLRRAEFLVNCDALIAVSQSTKSGLLQHLNYPEERIFVVHEGSSKHFKPLAPSEEYQSLEFYRLQHAVPAIRGPGFLMYVGGSDFRKNEERLIQAYGHLPSKLREKHQLVLVSKKGEPEVKKLRENFQEYVPGFQEDQLVITNFIDESTLVRLYQFCGVFVFPSLYEGFGLPIIEAIQSGALVITSGVSSTKELVPQLELQFDPLDTESISDRIRSVLEMSQSKVDHFKSQLQQSLTLYNWKSVTEELLKTYEKVVQLPAWSKPDVALSSVSSAKPSDNPRSTTDEFQMALFSPWPPSSADTSEYSRAFLAALFQTWLSPRISHFRSAFKNGLRVDVYVDCDQVPLEQLRPAGTSSLSRVRFLSHEQFRFQHVVQPYHGILYCMDNDGQHAYMLPYIRQYPGSVMMHDVRFEQVYLESFRKQYQGSIAHMNGKMRSTIMLMDGRLELFNQIPENILDDQGKLAKEMMSGTGQQITFMNEEIVSRARRVFVFSSFAKRMLALRNSDALHKISVIPYGHHAVDRQFLWQNNILDTTADTTPLPRTEVRAVKSGPSSPVIISVFNGQKSSEIISVIQACSILEIKRKERGEGDLRIPPFRLVLIGGQIPIRTIDTLPHTVKDTLTVTVVNSGESPVGLHDEYMHWMGRSHIAVHLSSNSGSKHRRMLADCLSAGIATIVCGTGDVREIEHNAAVFISPHAPVQEMASALERLLIEKSTRESIGREGRRYATRNSFEANAHAYLKEIISEV